MGILERDKDGKPSKVRTTVIPNRKKKALQAEVRKHVEAGSALYTDALFPTMGWLVNMPIKLWITPCSTLMARYTRTGWRISGRS